MGRPPVAQKVPYGSCEILNFEIDDTSMHSGFEGCARQYSDIKNMGRIDIGNNQNMRGVEKDVANEADGIDDAEEADFTVATCERTDVEADTSDLAKLLHPQSCNNIFRSSGTFGYSLTGLSNIAEVLYDCNLPLQLPSPERPLVAKRQQHLYRVLSDQQTFYSYHRHFMTGPSFSDSFRGAITVVFARSGGVLLDAYLAALALWNAQHNRMKTLDEVNPREGSNCLKQLQAAAIVDAHDAAAVIMLGQVLVVYHIILLGTSAHAILRQSLLLVKDWLPSLLSQPCLYPITVTSILVDTVECLVKREIPVIQPPRGDYSTVDRTFGLCNGLIYILYELCMLSHEAKKSACAGNELADIERRVRVWEPAPPTTFFNQFSRLEVSAMMLQARVYRLATLLIIHRLQYPLGVEDHTALRLAMKITVELECFVDWVPVEMKGLPIGLPLLVSSLEIDSLSEEVIKYVSPVTTGESEYGTKLKAFASLVKATRDNGYRGLWFDLVEGGLHIPVPLKLYG
ncbi:unnamed protein product [Colletotrichum noveboracense]|uniref:Uncharacterized protein n=1 Tax=Colletotrichum noveboracense TaxID=2664923 RepID=A0A9W4S2T8_9PEZI|nr:unnamed protein product [Colletotrichum noveboracense]